MADAADLLTLRFLDWLAAAMPRPWRPGAAPALTLSIWEDALAEGLVRVESGATRSESRVVLTAKGCPRLQSHAIVNADGRRKDSARLIADRASTKVSS